MTIPAEMASAAVPAPDGTGPMAVDSPRLLRLSRGFSCVFWSLPLLSAAHAMALMSVVPARWMAAGLLAGFAPLGCGLGLLRTCGDLTPRWAARTSGVALLAMAAAALCPFLAWWGAAPLRLYFAANAAAHYVVVVALLAGLDRLAGECARRLGDQPLRREAQAGMIVTLWLSACTVGAVAWLFQRAGILSAGAETVLWHVSRLRGEAYLLCLLPYAMTAYVLWRAKETGLRHAVGAA